jgi:hypothetical protein
MNNYILDTKTYNLSTRASAGTILNTDPNYKSYIQYNIPELGNLSDESIEFIHISVPYAIIPVSFYTINHTNNTLDMTFNNTRQTFVFQYGNYNVTLFIAEFDKLLKSYGFTLEFDQTDSVFTMKNSTYAFTLHGTSTIDYIIGFENDISTTLVAGVNTLDMPRCCNFLPLPRIYLKCAEFSCCSNIGNINSGDILATIPNNAKPNGQIYYQNNSGAKSLFRKHGASTFKIAFTNDDGEFINFNGVSAHFSIQFDIYRTALPKLESFSEIVKKYTSGAKI